MTRTFAQPADEGMTLIELLIAVLAFAIIMPAVAVTFILGLKTSDETTKRLIDSRDIQTSAAFVNVDVQSAQKISVTDTTTCIDPALPASSAVLLLTWTDASAVNGSTELHHVNYYVSSHQLVRSACAANVSGGAPSGIVIVHGLSPTTAPGVVCQQPTNCSDPTNTPVSLALRGETVGGQFFSLIGTRRAS